jgi:hypothetical protein
MLIIAKVALGLGATLAMATAYTFHEGVINVDVDESRHGGKHVHFWLPATTVSAGLRLTPKRYLRNASEHVRPYLPLLRVVAKELEKYPNAELVDVTDSEKHVRIAMVNGKLHVDAVGEGDTVHLIIPAETLRDVADRLEDASPSI